MEQILLSMPADIDPTLALPDPTLVRYYENISKRTIWVDGEIDETCYDWIELILKWNREDKDKPVEERTPIRLFFNSVGGSLDVQAAVCDIIELSVTPIIGIAVSLVASAASLIYMSCHERIALPSAYLILHKGSCSNIGGDYESVQASIKDYEKKIEKMIDFIVTHTMISREEANEKMKNDWYLNTEEAIKLGIIDRYVESINELI